MIEVLRENPCTECGIKGLYEHCEDKCVQYRKWYQYQQGRADVIEPIKAIIQESEKMMWHSSKTLKKIQEQLKEQTE